MVSNGALIAPGMCPSGPRYADDGRTSTTTICWLSRIISAAIVGAISAYPPVVFDTPTVRQAQSRKQKAETRNQKPETRSAPPNLPVPSDFCLLVSGL